MRFLVSILDTEDILKGVRLTEVLITFKYKIPGDKTPRTLRTLKREKREKGEL